jgi:DNA-binding response OmpR family regulator
MAQILLVEDEFRLRENISELLELFEHQVVSAENGLEGLELIKSFKPDIIVCDIMMPVLNGLEFIKQLNLVYKNKSIPVIFISAKVNTEDISEGMRLGATDYIKKPFTINELTEKINNILSSTLS